MTNKQAILIIDDIKDNIDILKRQLDSDKYDIHESVAGAEGLEILKKQHIDLLMLDINMPVLDGITLLGKIREDDALSHVAVLMVTANDDVKMALDCLKNGACGYITKPYSIEQIKQQMNHCLK